MLLRGYEKSPTKILLVPALGLKTCEVTPKTTERNIYDRLERQIPCLQCACHSPLQSVSIRSRVSELSGRQGIGIERPALKFRDNSCQQIMLTFSSSSVNSVRESVSSLALLNRRPGGSLACSFKVGPASLNAISF